MSDTKSPETLTDLLRTLERSQDLRPLARECGLSLRELRRRLARWRRELGTEPSAPRSTPARGGGKAASFPELTAAAEIAECPLPDSGSPVLEIFTDGASRGNPGPAAVGVLFRQKDGPELCSHREAIGKATNNQAEYRAVLAALEHCRRWGVGKVHLFLDSELVARQLAGTYRVKSQDLQPLYQQVMHLARGLREFRIRHVPRAKNAHADHLANQALDDQSG
jgi:ribonuclease HI